MFSMSRNIVSKFFFSVFWSEIEGNKTQWACDRVYS